MDSKTISRNQAVDLMKGLLIILMIIGHFPMGEIAYDALYSFHMMAFVLLSGYFYKPEASTQLGRGLYKLIKAYMVPYGVFVIIYCAMFRVGLKLELKMAFLAMSNVSKVLENRAALIGPIYFIPMLFLTRLLFLFLARFFKKDLILTGVVLCLSLIGYFLGRGGYWLPWSFDISMYVLIYYLIGYMAHKYHVLSYLKGKPLIWAGLFIGWLAAVYLGSMDIFVRQYNIYPVAVIGAVCGSVLFYFVCEALCKLLGKATSIFGYAGKSTAYILIVHTQFEYFIGKKMQQYFTLHSFGYCLIMIVIQLIIGAAMYFVISSIVRVLEHACCKVVMESHNLETERIER